MRTRPEPAEFLKHLAWTRKHVPREFRDLGPGDLLIAKAQYNALLLSVAPAAAVRLVLQRLRRVST